MTLDTPQPASAEPEPKPVQPLEQPNQPPAQPASEPEEPFDKERAMNTIRQLREIEKKAKADQKELEKFKAEEQKRIEAQMTEAEKLKKQNLELTQRAKELELSVMRRDVIAETNLPPVLAERLKGETKEEMLEDAKKLMESLPQVKVKPNQAPTNPGGATINETEAQMRERLLGTGQGNIFDINTVRRMGGGVTQTK